MVKSAKMLGVRIKTLREERGWTQAECAAHLGFHYSYVGHLEAGNKNITLATAEKIASGFGISLEELFKGL